VRVAGQQESFGDAKPGVVLREGVHVRCDCHEDVEPRRRSSHKDHKDHEGKKFLVILVSLVATSLSDLRVLRGYLPLCLLRGS
jgi:hypothetical protein